MNHQCRKYTCLGCQRVLATCGCPSLDDTALHWPRGRCHACQRIVLPPQRVIIARQQAPRKGAA